MYFVNPKYLVIGFSFFYFIESKPDCLVNRDEFIQNLINFERCIIQYSATSVAPATFCRNCVKLYVWNLQAYQKFASTPLNENSTRKCTDDYFGQDQFNLAWNKFQETKDFWRTAACTSCFVSNCVPEKLPIAANVTEICKIGAQVTQTQEFVDHFNKCVSESSGDICKECLDPFEKLDAQYEKLKSNQAGVCYETVYAFNRSQNVWYNHHHCGHIKTAASWALLWIVFAIICMGGLGYTGYYAYRRWEYIHTYADIENTETQDQDAIN